MPLPTWRTYGQHCKNAVRTKPDLKTSIPCAGLVWGREKVAQTGSRNPLAENQCLGSTLLAPEKERSWNNRADPYVEANYVCLRRKGSPS
jgi:hypothetical protein